MMIEISVVIPNYNRTTETLSAVVSVLRQTHPVIEILIVDDGSNQATLDFLQSEVRPLSDKVKVVKMNHSGHPGIVRNKGISISKGNWIAFLDSDDTWEPTKIETQVQRSFSSGARAIGENLPGKQRVRRQWRLIDTHILMKRNALICSSVLVQKSLIEKVGNFPDNNYSIGIEDYITWLKVSTQTNWHLSSGNEVKYDVASEKRLSKSMETQSRFTREVALLQFAEWKYKSTQKSSLRLRIFNKILRRAI
jgi:teichuronic acid biosynthesis glycosyltransferase TuaG